MAKLPRGLRNNNPGNIEDGKYAQSLPGYIGSDGRFAVFDSMDAGAHAMQRLLSGYGRKGLKTVEGVINRWAPPTENDTGAYANTVAAHLGVKATDDIDLNDPATLAKLSSAMAGVENGQSIALGYVDPTTLKASAPAAPETSGQALDALANGSLRETAPEATIQNAGYVQPPFSGQQPQFAPLFAPSTQPQDQQQEEPQAAPAPPVAQSAPGADDLLKAWGLQDDGSAPAPVATENPDEALIKAWGLDETDAAPAEGLAKAEQSAPAQSFGASVGQAIDDGIKAAQPALNAAGEAMSFDNNLVRQTATGVPIIGGLLNKANAATNALIAPAINPMLSDANRLKGETWGERYENSLREQNALDADFQAAHPVVSTGAQIAGGVASMGGLAAKVPAVARILGATGNSLAARAGAGLVSGAGVGGADAAIRSEGDLGKTATGAVLGGAVGAAAPYVGNALGAAANKLAGTNIPTRVAELAKLASEKYGINLGAGQLSSNPTIRFLDSVVNRLPLSGGTASKQAQQTAFNKAVASSFGENASEITPEVMSAARSRIGKVFDSVADRTPVIRQDQAFLSGVKGALDEAKQTLTKPEIGPLEKQVGNILNKFIEGKGSISGETYQALTRKGAPLDRAMQSSDPNIRFYAGKLRDELDSALERSALPEVIDDLRAARSQWKAMKTVEDLAEKSPTGDVSPTLLLGQVRNSYGNMAYGGNNDLVDLARIGQQFLKEMPSSGTAERSHLMNLLLGGAGGGGVVSMLANPATIPYVAGPAVGGALTARLVGAALRSPWLGNKLVEGALNAGKNIAPTTGNMLLRSAGQGSLPTINRLATPRH
jgi:hypothetical protein